VGLVMPDSAVDVYGGKFFDNYQRLFHTLVFTLGMKAAFPI
jgi:hypothetical protein